MTNNGVNNQIKINRLFGLCRCIAVVFGAILLSTWNVKSATLINSNKQVLQQNLYKEITGIVKTQEGDPIPGVVVKLAGTNVETVTDAEGRYKFNVKKGKKIQFVFEGFKTVMFTVSQSNVLNIAMVEDDTDTTFSVIEDIYRTMVKDRMAHGNNVSSDIIVKRRQDSIFKEITGIVKTQEGDPIPGVVVKLAGTNVETVTDDEGRYKFSVKKGDKIQFFYRGYKTSMATVRRGNVLNVKMIKDDTDLPDVIISFNYHSATGCTIDTANVKKTELNKNHIVDVAFPLVFNVDMRPSEVYRNPETILKDAEALTRNGSYTYIVDGVRVSEETFRSLNQNDVESVDIYKHTDVYNARFGNKENQSRVTLEAK